MKHRRHRRIEAKGVAAQLGADGAVSQVENISAGGLFVRTASLLPIGTPVRVELTKQGLAAPVVVTGRVASVVTDREAQRQGTTPGVGIELDRLPNDATKRLHALLRDLGLKDLADTTEIKPTQPVEANVRGLLEMLTDALQKVKERDDEIARLKAEIRRLEARP